jgi:hypothetical protein
MTTHTAAEHVISIANGLTVLGQTIQCSWGTKSTTTTNKAAVAKSARTNKGMCDSTVCMHAVAFTHRQYVARAVYALLVLQLSYNLLSAMRLYSA